MLFEAGLVWGMRAPRSETRPFFRYVAAFAGILLSWSADRCLGAALVFPSFDFRVASETRLWVPQHDLQSLTGSAEGLVASISGPDPYFAGPARDYPVGRDLWLNVRLRSDAGGMAQVFYYRDGAGPTEAASVRFAVRGAEWVTVRVPVPALGSAYRLRLDPPGDAGKCVFERLWFDERVQFAAPAWPAPVEPTFDSLSPRLVSGPLELVYARSGWGTFALEVAGRRVAIGQSNPLFGYVLEGTARWWSPTASGGSFELVPAGTDGLEGRLVADDPDGARWELRQRLVPGAVAGTIEVRTSVRVDRDRTVLHVPALVLFAGRGTVGTNKQQALLAGVEYLENEPSSSQADLEGAQARRQVTDTTRLTFPLAAVVAADRYLALTWQMRPEVGVVFDTPDRIFGSRGHAMGLIVPGSDGANREEGSLVPYEGYRLAAGVPLEIIGHILGGVGSNTVPAVQHYVRLHGWPAAPETGLTATAYARLAAHGWLDTPIRDGDRYRHAVVGGTFASQPAADAAWQMEWLAGQVDDPALAERLRVASKGALHAVAVGDRYASGVGHVRYPVAPLVYGGVAEAADAAAAIARGQLRRFSSDGTIRYAPVAGGLNYARTHWTNEANGLAAPVVVSVLESALFSGDRLLLDAGLRQLRALDKFRGTVPRGAQTWEIPLHTPDILASAHLVRAYTLGYEVTGDPGLLEVARYWAWTGIPFVFLRAPVDGPVGLYATTPVLGATQWVAPNWIGLPVQWCGLVYADALYRFARHDPAEIGRASCRERVLRLV